jgi:hypothetical protein
MGRAILSFTYSTVSARIDTGNGSYSRPPAPPLYLHGHVVGVGNERWRRQGKRVRRSQCRFFRWRDYSFRYKKWTSQLVSDLENQTPQILKPFDTILNSFHPAPILTTNLPNMHFNVILTSSSQCSTDGRRHLATLGSLTEKLKTIWSIPNINAID